MNLPPNHPVVKYFRNIWWLGDPGDPPRRLFRNTENFARGKSLPRRSGSWISARSTRPRRPHWALVAALTAPSAQRGSESTSRNSSQSTERWRLNVCGCPRGSEMLADLGGILGKGLGALGEKKLWRSWRFWIDPASSSTYPGDLMCNNVVLQKNNWHGDIKLKNPQAWLHEQCPTWNLTRWETTFNWYRALSLILPS